MNTKIEDLASPAAVKALKQLADFINPAEKEPAMQYAVKLIEKGYVDENEVNQLAELFPSFARVLATELKVSIGGLRRLAYLNHINVAVMIQALENQAEKINQQWVSAPEIQRNIEWQSVKKSFSNLL